MTRCLTERCQTEHRAAAQIDARVARARVLNSDNSPRVARATKIQRCENEKKTRCTQVLNADFFRGLLRKASPTKNDAEACADIRSTGCALPCKIIGTHQIKHGEWRGIRANSPNIAPAAEHDFQNHLYTDPPLMSAYASHADGKKDLKKVERRARVKQKRRSRPKNEKLRYILQKTRAARR